MMQVFKYLLLTTSILLSSSIQGKNIKTTTTIVP